MIFDPATILRCALDRDAVQTMELTGLSQARVTQLAIQLADDPQVAIDHADLVQRVHAILEQGRAQRDGSRIS